MKKLLSLAITILLAFSLTACIDTTGTDSDLTPSIGGNSDSLDTGTEVTLAETVIFDQGNVKITVTGINNTGFFGPEIKLLIENNSTQNLTVQTKDSAVNGAMIDTIFSEDVAAGKKANSAITLMSSELDASGIKTIKDIEFKIHLFDTDSFDDVTTSETVRLTTSADTAFVQTFDKSGEAIYDADGIKVVAKKMSSEDSFWGSELYLYIENNTEKYVTLQTKDVSVNGFMIDPIFSCDVLPGKVAFSSITFLESDLTDNSITDISELELKLHIFDAESWDTIKDTETIKISFN